MKNAKTVSCASRIAIAAVCIASVMGAASAQEVIFRTKDGLVERPTVTTEPETPEEIGTLTISKTLGGVAEGLINSTVFSAVDGIAPYTWSVAPSSSLPPHFVLLENAGGVTLIGNGSLEVEGRVVRIKVEDSNGDIGYIDHAITLDRTPMGVLSGIYYVRPGQDFEIPLRAMKGTPPYTFKVVGGYNPAVFTNVAPDLTIPGNMLVGTAPGATDYDITLSMVDSEGRAAPGTFTVIVRSSNNPVPASMPYGDFMMYGGTKMKSAVTYGILPMQSVTFENAPSWFTGYPDGRYEIEAPFNTCYSSPVLIRVTDAEGREYAKSITPMLIDFEDPNLCQ